MKNIETLKKQLKTEIINNILEYITNEQSEYERIASELGITEEDMDIQTFIDDFTLDIKVAIGRKGI